MSTLPIPVFLDHYASGPSGITTYGAHLAAHLPDLYRINLHADAALPGDRRTIRVPPARSHDPDHVARTLVDIVRYHPGRHVAWLPNVGDVAWAAAWRALDVLSAEERDRVRLFGIVHGDQESQYAAMRRYAPIIAGLAGVSQRCVDLLNRHARPGGAVARPLHYPVLIPGTRSDDEPTRPLRLLYAGRFEESQKRVSRLPVLFDQLALVGVPFTASLAGDGPARAAIEAQVRALSADTASRVSFRGTVPQSQMARVLCEHDVILLVSAFEGTPLVLLEAMASGVCPVLMDLPGGLPELLGHGDNACIVPQGDVPAMVAAIRRLHLDRVGLARMKAAARLAIEARADPAAHAADLQRRLCELWTTPPPDPRLVSEPDPLGRRVDRLVKVVRAACPRRVGVWGGGVVGRQIVDRLLAAGITPALIVDADPVRHGAYRGIAVSAPAALAAAAPDLVCVGSVAFSTEIVAALQAWPSPPRVLAP